MGKLQIALLEREDYVTGFSAYVSRKKETWVQLHCFTDGECLKKYLQKKQADILLLGEDFFGDDYPCIRSDYFGKRAKEIFLLSEKGQDKNVAGCTVIFKYQPVEEILRRVCGQAALSENVSRVCFGFPVYKKQFIGIGSFLGDCRSILFSQKLCAQKKANHKILYVNLHQLDMMSKKEKKISGMSDLIYYIHQKGKNASLKLHSLICEYQGFPSIFPVEDYRDLESLTIADVELFLEILSQQTDYELIVFDIGFFREASVWLMQKCDVVYIQKDNGEMGRRKQEVFEELLRREGMEELLEKLNYVDMSDVESEYLK